MRRGSRLTQQNAQAELIRKAQAVTYTYDANGQLTKVKDELGFETSYTYDVNGNLISITDANGWGVANLDTGYYQKLRTSLGYSAALSGLDTNARLALLDKFTSKFTYDANGNLLTSTGQCRQHHHVHLHVTSTRSRRSRPRWGTRRGSSTTRPESDPPHRCARQHHRFRLRRQRAADDRRSSTSTRTTWLRQRKQQVTPYGYDALGNNTSSTTRTRDQATSPRKTFDHFGNLTRPTDGRQQHRPPLRLRRRQPAAVDDRSGGPWTSVRLRCGGQQDRHHRRQRPHGHAESSTRTTC